MWIPGFILKIVGRKVANKLDLQEDTKMDNKPWYKSQTIWSAAVIGIIGIYNAVASVKGLPPVPEWVYTILAAVGINGRIKADTKIG